MLRRTRVRDTRFVATFRLWPRHRRPPRCPARRYWRGRSDQEIRIIAYARFDFKFVAGTGSQHAEVTVSDLILAGWTGRDRAALEEPIVEMEKLGIPRPTYAELVDHWDELVLSAWADGDLYQEAPVAAMLSPAELMQD